MAAEEKIVIDNLFSISKSLSKIADELSMIRNLFALEQQYKLKESRKEKNNNSKMLTETNKKFFNKHKNFIPKTSDEAMNVVKKIMSGELIS